MHEILSFFLLGITSFFTLINPLALMPIYTTMTSNLSSESKKKTLQKASIIAFLALIIFALSGELLFKFFGISVDSLKIVGGVIFFSIGQNMLQANITPTKLKKEDVHEYVNDISITPLAIPMICGPGAITNAIVLMGQDRPISYKLILILSIVVIGFITYFILRSSNRIMKVLGDTGNKVMMRIMGLIVMVIAVEFFVGGATPIIRTILKI